MLTSQAIWRKKPGKEKGRFKTEDVAQSEGEIDPDTGRQRAG